jgi:undecaprenyl-diphosphatase
LLTGPGQDAHACRFLDRLAAGASCGEPIPFLDTPILRFFGGFAHRSEAFDTFVLAFVRLDLFKGAIVLAILVWLWFDFDPAKRARRAILVQSVLGAIVAALASQAIQSGLNRPRPIMGAADFVRLYGITDTDIEWMKSIHSFLSDHAAFFGAVAIGIWLTDRRWGLFAFAWTIVVADVPRVYAGLHYPSDILAGLLLGVAVTLAMRRPALALVEPVLRWEKAHPASFYCASFLALYEMARLFDEVRELVRSFCTPGEFCSRRC